MVSHLIVRDYYLLKSPQISRILLGILAELNNDGAWIVYTRPVIS